jgi:hypothetical protein
MTTTDTIIRNKIESNDAKIQRAVEMGGLPTEAEVVEFYKVLADVEDHLERLTWRIEGITSTDVGDDLPFDISLEQIGAVATLTSDVEIGLGTLTELHERARSRIFSLSAIRAEQQSRLKQ